jgi:hypothetical protein
MRLWGLVFSALAVVAFGAVQFHTYNDYGDAQRLALDTETPVDLRSGCRIAVFGTAPWLKPGRAKDKAWELRTHKALALMGIPPEAANIAVERMRSGKADDAVAMGNTTGIGLSSGQVYAPRFTTTYLKNGRGAVCRDSRTRFRTDTQMEYAVLYKIQYAGRTYHLGEFLACGNVSQFMVRDPAAPIRPGGTQSEAPIQPGDAQSEALIPGVPMYPEMPVVNEVPEPSTLALLCLALLLGRKFYA